MSRTTGAKKTGGSKTRGTKTGEKEKVDRCTYDEVKTARLNAESVKAGGKPPGTAVYKVLAQEWKYPFTWERIGVSFLPHLPVSC